jgi:hypothetical protein
VPSCTECGGANFVLVTSNETNPIGRCVVSVRSPMISSIVPQVAWLGHCRSGWWLLVLAGS